MSNTQASPLEIFLEYYRRRLKTATDAIEALPQTEENIHTHIRMTTKASCYRDFIYELQMVISTPPQEPSAKAIAEAAKNTCDIPGCKKIAPQNDIFCKDHRY